MLQIQKQINRIFRSEFRDLAMPWQSKCGMPNDGPPRLLPKHVGNNKTFSALNTLLLWKDARDRHYTSNQWGSVEAWAEQGETPREYQQSTMLFHFDDSPRQSLAWTTHVYNRCQLASYDPAKPDLPKLKALSTRVAKVKEFIADLNPEISDSWTIPYDPAEWEKLFIPSIKSIHKLPTPEEQEHYYSSLFFGVTHWTGHVLRCDTYRYGSLFSKERLFESLICLIGSSMLSAKFEMKEATRIGGCDFNKVMLEKLTSDPAFFLSATQAADKALAYLSGYAMNAKHILKPSHPDKAEHPKAPAQVIPLTPAASKPHFGA